MAYNNNNKNKKSIKDWLTRIKTSIWLTLKIIITVINSLIDFYIIKIYIFIIFNTIVSIILPHFEKIDSITIVNFVIFIDRNFDITLINFLLIIYGGLFRIFVLDFISIAIFFLKKTNKLNSNFINLSKWVKILKIWVWLNIITQIFGFKLIFTIWFTVFFIYNLHTANTFFILLFMLINSTLILNLLIFVTFLLIVCFIFVSCFKNTR